ncbi:MAG: hypothetical protein KGL39_53795 [Patescibacteria group bacterium]|nr:hypothetical protein [Patescibacteria group bacterium]
MTNERRELIKALAVASYPHAVMGNWSINAWLSGIPHYADCLLAALDQQSPPTQEAAPGGEPKERVCVWKITRGFEISARDCKGRVRGLGIFEFCPTCGGKIITEAT